MTLGPISCDLCGEVGGGPSPSSGAEDEGSLISLVVGTGGGQAYARLEVGPWRV